MNVTNGTKDLLIDYYKTNRKKNIISLKKGFFKSFTGQNKVNSCI